MKAPKRVLYSSLALSFLLALSSLALAQDTKNFNWNGQLSPGQTVTIKSINGDIDASPAPGNQVEVTAEASGRDAQDVQFEARPDSDGVTICEIYPGVDSCNGGSTEHHNNNHIRIHYTVHVPAANRFTAQSVNGGIVAKDLDREVKANTVNGGVKVSTKSWAEARSVNGSVEAMMGSANWEGTLHLESVNGAIHVGLPANANTDVEVRTVNGSFSSELPVNSQALTSHHVQGRIGNGGRELKLSTVNGSVHLVKSGS
ncbi:MAG TPA: DUF4097 family beta strand repeat-containing protein [Candidatus Angelobacter sp.]|nr:DUF4097 family beta strand repeat-containing protein [Candidatus Angelobacter sp.]